MIDPEAEQQMKVLDLMKGSEDKDVQFLLWQLGLDLGNDDHFRKIRSFRRQIIVTAVDYAQTSC